MSEEPADKLADQLRRLYYRVRREHLLRSGCPEELLPPEGHPAWDGGVDPYGKKYKPVWPKLAKFVLTNNLDPQKLVQAVFAKTVGGDPPLPNMLMSDAALAAVYWYKDAEKTRVKSDIEASKEEARTFIFMNAVPGGSAEKVWRNAILDPKQRNPLIRYVLSLSANQPDLALYFRQLALEEYLRHVEPYDEYLGQELPAGFRADALRLKEAMLAKLQQDT